MSAGRDTSRDAIRARLEWLRLLGVEDLPKPARRSRPETGPGRPSPARAVDQAPSRPVAASPRATGQVPLFEGITPAPPPPADRVAGRDPLAGVTAPEGVDAATALRMIRDDLGDCRRCRLCDKRTQIVFGVGDPGARLMFIGEGPGADEDRQGEPFVGRAGQLLTRIIESIGLSRQQVYIANVVKCRPPENRTPLSDEVATCSPFLFRQIRAIGPRIIVCLGTPATQTVLGTGATITRLRGTFHDREGLRVMPTFHPAYLLRNPAAKKEVWEDMKKVMAALKAE